MDDALQPLQPLQPLMPLPRHSLGPALWSYLADRPANLLLARRKPDSDTLELAYDYEWFCLHLSVRTMLLSLLCTNSKYGLFLLLSLYFCFFPATVVSVSFWLKRERRKNWERISAFSHLSNNGCSKHCQSLQPQLSLNIPCQNSFSPSNSSILKSKPVFTKYKLYNKIISLKTKNEIL